MSGVVLVHTTDEFRGAVETAYNGSLNGSLRVIDEAFASTVDLVDHLATGEPDVIAIGPDISSTVALEVLSDIELRHPGHSVVLILDPTTDLWPRALRAGARDIITPSTKGDNLFQSLERAAEATRNLRRTMGTGIADPRQGHRSIAVISPKGGSGKTTVATNLAVTLARQSPDQVVLADLDVQFGDVAHALRLEPDYSLLHAISGDGDTATLKAFLTPHHDTDLLTMCAPDSPEDADDITAAASSAVLGDLSGLFPFVVIDTAAGLDDHTLAAVELATDLVVVSATDVPSVRAVVKELDLLGRLGLLEPRGVHLVLNRADARVGLSANDISKTIGLDVSFAIPSSRAIPAALNQGQPVVDLDRRSALAKGFETFAEQLGATAVDHSGRGWRWGR